MKNSFYKGALKLEIDIRSDSGKPLKITSLEKKRFFSGNKKEELTHIKRNETDNTISPMDCRTYCAALIFLETKSRSQNLKTKAPTRIEHNKMRLQKGKLPKRRDLWELLRFKWLGFRNEWLGS
ncbi:Uncharacterized protein XB17_00659 [Leptospira santarosai]|nr:Uncharacterized protein XB17_00659 [Leptospira santarosai]